MGAFVALRVTVRAVDLLAAAGAATSVVVSSVVKRRPEPVTDHARPRRLVTLEGDYSLGVIRSRGLEQIITSRDLDGYFDHVWTVNPTVGADPNDPEGSGVGLPSVTPISDRHTMIEGTTARTERLQAFPVLNFVLAQAALVRKLHHLIRTERISMVRASEPYYLGLLGMLLARAHRLPLVVRLIANYDAGIYATGRAVHPRLFRRRSVERRIERHVLRSADLVAAGNRDICGYALANGATEDRLTVFLVGSLIAPFHFGEDPAQRPSVRGELGLEGRPFLICVTRLEEDKHPADFLRVLADARREVPDLAGLLVGDGSLRPELESLAQELGIAHDLLLSGNREQRWIANALSSADVVVSPLTGRALVEAALSGTVIVAYDVDWQSELVRTGDTGVLVEFRNTAQMAEAVCRLLADPLDAAALGARARALALDMMDPPRLVDHERREYEKLLSRRRTD